MLLQHGLLVALSFPWEILACTSDACKPQTKSRLLLTKRPQVAAINMYEAIKKRGDESTSANETRKIGHGSENGGKNEIRVPEANVTVQVDVAKDASSATLHFEFGGYPFRYNLLRHSLYGIQAQTPSSGIMQPADNSSTFAFRSRKTGKWASAIITANGFVSGLFESHGFAMHMQPVEATATSASDSKLVPENARHIHVVEQVSLAKLFQHTRGTAANANFPREASFVQNRWGWLTETVSEVGQTVTETVTDFFEEGKPLVPESLTLPIEVQPFFPGCYDGDVSRHKITIGLIADYPLYQKKKEDTRSYIEGIVGKTSHMLERQFNIRVEISHLVIYKSPQQGPPYVHAQCNEGGEWIEHQRERLMKGLEEDATPFADYRYGVPTEKAPSSMAAVGLITGCDLASWRKDGKDLYTWGQAIMNGLCNPQNVFGVSGQKSWELFAHEVGHILGANHHEEPGLLGKNDGSMGSKQYHPVNKEKVCTILSKKKQSEQCYDKFQVDDQPECKEYGEPGLCATPHGCIAGETDSNNVGKEGFCHQCAPNYVPVQCGSGGCSCKENPDSNGCNPLKYDSNNIGREGYCKECGAEYLPEHCGTGGCKCRAMTDANGCFIYGYYHEMPNTPGWCLRCGIGFSPGWCGTGGCYCFANPDKNGCIPFSYSTDTAEPGFCTECAKGYRGVYCGTGGCFCHEE